MVSDLPKENRKLSQVRTRQKPAQDGRKIIGKNSSEISVVRSLWALGSSSWGRHIKPAR